MEARHANYRHECFLAGNEGEVTVPMDPRQGEVWALFGWLVGLGQLIEDHLRTIVASGPDPFTRTVPEFEAVIQEFHKQKATMGILVGKLTEAGADAGLIARLRDDVLPDRNVLVHHYMVRRGTELGSPEGRTAILAELRPVAEEFEETTRALGEVIRVFLQRLGWSDDDIDHRSVEATRATRDRLRSSVDGTSTTP
jgi:hypothetical protein